MAAGERRSGDENSVTARGRTSWWLFRLSEVATVGLFLSVAVVLLWRIGVGAQNVAALVGDIGVALAVVILAARLVGRLLTHGQSR